MERLIDKHFQFRKSSPAQVIYGKSSIDLSSYGTHVASIVKSCFNDCDYMLSIDGIFSATTRQHISRFLKEFNSETGIDYWDVRELWILMCKGYFVSRLTNAYNSHHTKEGIYWRVMRPKDRPFIRRFYNIYTGEVIEQTIDWKSEV